MRYTSDSRLFEHFVDHLQQMFSTIEDSFYFRFNICVEVPASKKDLSIAKNAVNRRPQLVTDVTGGHVDPIRF